MKENTIISLADANYFELLNELVDSINRFEQSKKLDICIMDAGLKDDQIKEFIQLLYYAYRETYSDDISRGL